MKKKFFFFIINFIFLVGIKGQSGITSSGGDASGGGGEVSYSVGQVCYSTQTSNGAYVGQGVQQPYEIFIITSIDETTEIELVATVYPNPVTNYITLNIENIDLSGLSFQLYGMNGGILKNEKITRTQTKIDMEKRVMGSYFIKVLKRDKEIKTFKIIKN